MIEKCFRSAELVVVLILEFDQMQPVISFGVIDISGSTCRHYSLQIALILNCRLHKEIPKCQGHSWFFIFLKICLNKLIVSYLLHFASWSRLTALIVWLAGRAEDW